MQVPIPKDDIWDPTLCFYDGTDENALQKLRYLNIWSPVGDGDG